MHYEMTLSAEVAVFYNDPARGGYRTAGTSFPKLEETAGEGFLIDYRQDGSGTAILCRAGSVGDRDAQFNVSVRWSQLLPMCFLSALKRSMEELRPEDAGPQILWLEDESDVLPAASSAMLAGILEAVCTDSCCFINTKDGIFTEQDVFAALSRLPMFDKAFSIALPLPSNAAPCDIALLPENLQFYPVPAKKRVILVDTERACKAAAPNHQALAQLIAGAAVGVVKHAVSENSMRVYQLYGALRSGRFTAKEEDRTMLASLLRELDEQDKDDLLMERLIRSPAASALPRRRTASAEKKTARKKSRAKAFAAVPAPLKKLLLLLVCLVVTTAAASLNTTVTTRTVILVLRDIDFLPLALTAIWAFALGFQVRN